MPFDKPRLFSGDGVPQTGSDPAIGFDLRSDLSSQDSSPQGLSSRKSVDEELGLSAELQVLAAHLRGEADALAERYAPATRPTSQSVRERRFSRRWVWQSMAVAVAGLVLLAWQIDRWQEAPPANAVGQVAASSVAVSPQQSSAHDATSAPGSSMPPVPPVHSPVSTNHVASVDPAVARHTQGIAEVGIDAPVVERHPPADQVEMLRLQVLGFEKVIRKLQAELIARDAAQIDSQRQIQSLQDEVAQLHKRLDDRGQ